MDNSFRKRFFRKHLDFPKWMGLKDVFSRMKLIPALYANLTAVKKETYKETYEEAVVRLSLSQEEINKKKNQYLMASSIYVLFGLLSLVYAVSFLKTVKWYGCFLATMVAIIFFAHAFQTHFWYTQMRKKKLGINFREWLCALFGY